MKKPSINEMSLTGDMSEKILSSQIRSFFPALNQKIGQYPLTYLDSAATSLKPQSVIDRITQFYTFESANVHRGAHHLSDEATQNFEDARARVANFLNVDAPEIIFVRGATEGLNLIAESFGQTELNENDEVLITGMEHHANIIPWQVICQKRKAKLIVAKITDQGEIDLADVAVKLSSRTKIFAFTGCSNTLGTVTPVADLVKMAKAHGAFTVVDGAQSIIHQKQNLRELGVDFFVFSGHKIFGPTGIGVVFGKRELLEKMPPYQTGGSMISEVTFEKTSYNVIPHKFEAGTPHIAGVIGLGEAIKFFDRMDFNEVNIYERKLMKMFTDYLGQFPKIHILGTQSQKAPIVSFVHENIHGSDFASILDQQGVAVRTGHLCTQPLLQRFQVQGFVRVSLAAYNNENDFYQFEKAFDKAIRMLQ